ncbi:MAG TPA: DUF4397 domain-containing protein [Candidatus Binatia bacterium]|nr:DUF4397 domain-containing protein [Candidatus Binatia bacterium]
MRKLAYLAFACLLASCGDIDDDQAKVRIVNALYDYDTLDLVVGSKTKVVGLAYGERSAEVRIGVTDREEEDPDGTTTTTAEGATTSSASSTSTATVAALEAEADATTTTTTVSSSTTTTTTTTTTTIATGTRTLQVFVDSLATRLIEQDVTLIAQQPYTLYAYQGVGSGERARLIVDQETKETRVEGKLKIRVADMAPSSGIVDLYVLKPGQAVADLLPSSTRLTPSEIAPYLDIDPGQYALALTQTGTKTVVFDSGPVDLTAGALATMIVFDDVGGGRPLRSLLVTR